MSDEPTADVAKHLRAELVYAKRGRNLGEVDNAQRDNDDKPEMRSEEERRRFRLRVHEAAARCRAAGVNIDDLVGPAVGLGDCPG